MKYIKKYTKEWAKKLSLEIWSYLRDHPEITRKNELPKKLWNKIKDLNNTCPLCSYCDEYKLYCAISCPLSNIKGQCNYFFKWDEAKTKEARAKYAGIIVEKIESWKV